MFGQHGLHYSFPFPNEQQQQVLDWRQQQSAERAAQQAPRAQQGQQGQQGGRAHKKLRKAADLEVEEMEDDDDDVTGAAAQRPNKRKQLVVEEDSDSSSEQGLGGGATNSKRGTACADLTSDGDSMDATPQLQAHLGGVEPPDHGKKQWHAASGSSDKARGSPLHQRLHQQEAKEQQQQQQPQAPEQREPQQQQVSEQRQQQQQHVPEQREQHQPALQADCHQQLLCQQQDDMQRQQQEGMASDQALHSLQQDHCRKAEKVPETLAAAAVAAANTAMQSIVLGDMAAQQSLKGGQGCHEVEEQPLSDQPAFDGDVELVISET
jgi:hypothetical protein